MNIVAVSQRVDILPDRGERRDALDQRLCAWLMAADYVPVGVPNGLDISGLAHDAALAMWMASVKPKAIVLSGGNDIGAVPERDRCEQFLIACAERHDLPMLGICRGMQMMAVSAGIGLKRVEGHVAQRHVIAGAVSGEVNSYHCHALSECPKDYEVLARSEDGEIEAIRHLHRNWEGWMWHPERESKFGQEDRLRLKALFG